MVAIVSDGNEIALFEQEEAELLSIQLLDKRVLHLTQHNTQHDGWGIHSTVWAGGIALLRYLSDRYHDDWKKLTVIDLGSGTGIVGLGVAAASKGKTATVLTDLPEALSLLRENLAQNTHHWNFGRKNHPPRCVQLVWGQRIDDEWLQQIARTPRMLITGADIVYRKTLFAPLLQTLVELDARLNRLTSKQPIETEFLLSCQSLRTHLAEFWKLARMHSFQVELIAVVELDDPSQLILATARVIHTTGQKNTKQDRKIPSERFPPKDGRIYIVRIRKLPYTFFI